LFAVATALQHRCAGLVTVVGRRGEFVSRTARHPLWIVGLVANLAGLLHAVEAEMETRPVGNPR
jgi:hypothetical protein